MHYDRNTGLPMIDGAKARVMQADGRIITTEERLTNKYGEISASNKVELLAKMAAIGADTKSGRIMQHDIADRTAKKISAAIKGNDQKTMVLSGATFAEELQEAMNRMGFCEEVVARKDVPDGMDNRIPVRRKDVTAVQLQNGGSFAIESIVEQPYYYPNDYYLTAQILI